MSLFSLFKKKPKPEMGTPESNDEVRAVLSSMGDNGASVRHVIHYAYPGDEVKAEDRPGVIDDLKARGFEVSDAAAAGGLVMEHHRSVAPDDFDALTGDLSNWFAARGWGYDGWECALQNAEAETVH